MAVSQHLPQPVRSASIWLPRAQVEKCQGFGRKRDMLVAAKLKKAGWPQQSMETEGVISFDADRKIAVIGGGIAGAALAAGLASRGAPAYH